MDKDKAEKTTVWAMATAKDQFILTQTADYLRDKDIELGVLATYEPSRPFEGTPWRFFPYDDQTLTSCCLWPHLPSGIDFRCVLSEEGMVNVYGPGGKPDRTFQIPEAGVFVSGAAGYGYVERIRAIGDGLYVCGAHRQVYRYVSGERNPLSGRWANIAGPMRQPPLGPAPAGDGEAFDVWAAQDVVLFNDLAGPSETDIYVTGDETWHFDGQQWRQLQLPADNETMHVIKVIDAERIVIGGRNGYLLLGNARTGFTNISHHDDNHTITGLEWFDGKLFIASAAGLFTYNPQTKRQEPYKTGLKVELVDAHLLEAKDGVLWSFGYKDLAYWDSREGGSKWVRVHHPDNPRVDEVKAKKASRQPKPGPDAAALSEQQHAQQLALGWLPKVQAGRLDVGGLMARVGHKGVGSFVLAQLTALGLKPEQVLRVNGGERYTVAVPKQGVELVLQCMNKTGKDAQSPERWGLAEVKLLTQNANPSSHWTGPWLGKLQPNSTQATLLAQARALWDEESANTGDQQTFFVDGPHGAQWAINLAWTSVADRLGSLKVLHMGGYLPWTE